jgi:hypothetical protein
VGTTWYYEDNDALLALIINQRLLGASECYSLLHGPNLRMIIRKKKFSFIFSGSDGFLK